MRIYGGYAVSPTFFGSCKKPDAIVQAVPYQLTLSNFNSKFSGISTTETELSESALTPWLQNLVFLMIMRFELLKQDDADLCEHDSWRLPTQKLEKSDPGAETQALCQAQSSGA
ncbi:hypothetical protein RB195_010817 [Necator americanus]|uniref:Uncharacterized protein n=1 Tax=Necator americanus TaxID=51031 RepID=A0ABR1D0U6_NECAM